MNPSWRRYPLAEKTYVTKIAIDGEPLVEKIASMRKLGGERTLAYKSHPDIVARLDLATARLALVERFRGAKLRTGHGANALVLWRAELPDDQLHAGGPPLLRRLEAYLRGEDATPAREK